VLLLSHGQASVDCGFLEIDNHNEDTFVAKRLICDPVTSLGVLKNQQQGTAVGSFLSET